MDGAVHETEPARFHGIMLACRTLVKHLILSSCTKMHQDQVENLDLAEVGVQLARCLPPASSRSGPYRSPLPAADREARGGGRSWASKKLWQATDEPDHGPGSVAVHACQLVARDAGRVIG